MYMERVRGLWCLVIAACSSPAAQVPQNVEQAASSLAIAPDEPLGWIGFAPLSKREADWIPAGTQAVIAPLPVDGLPPGGTVSAIGTSGGMTRVTAGAATKVAYGCDNHQLDVLAFTGDKPAPGVVWLLPPGAPTSWAPKPLAIAARVTSAADRRRDTVGPLVLELARTGDTHGTLAILRDGGRVYTMPIARDQMDGADTSPLDLAQRGVAIPEPVAAWSIGKTGPILLVLMTPSYEGLRVDAILVEDTRARDLPKLGYYLYQCAF
jgi:hypothetical protein